MTAEFESLIELQFQHGYFPSGQPVVGMQWEPTRSTHNQLRRAAVRSRMKAGKTQLFGQVKPNALSAQAAMPDFWGQGLCLQFWLRVKDPNLYRYTELPHEIEHGDRLFFQHSLQADSTGSVSFSVSKDLSEAQKLRPAKALAFLWKEPDKSVALTLTRADGEQAFQGSVTSLQQLLGMGLENGPFLVSAKGVKPNLLEGFFHLDAPLPGLTVLGLLNLYPKKAPSRNLLPLDIQVSFSPIKVFFEFHIKEENGTSSHFRISAQAKANIGEADPVFKAVSQTQPVFRSDRPLSLLKQPAFTFILEKEISPGTESEEKLPDNPADAPEVSASPLLETIIPALPNPGYTSVQKDKDGLYFASSIIYV